MSSSVAHETAASQAANQLPGYARMLDAYHRSRAAELRAIIATLPLRPHSRVLDVACGDGCYTHWLAERAGHYPSELSGGQKQRVAIARALAIRPKLMLFDEPTSALDPELRHEVLKVMQDLATEGMTMIVVTHEIGFARRVGTRLVFMDEGRIIEDGLPAALLDRPPTLRLQNFLKHVA